VRGGAKFKVGERVIYKGKSAVIAYTHSWREPPTYRIELITEPELGARRLNCDENELELDKKYIREQKLKKY